MTQKSALIKDPDWWRGAVIYQIYPRSFQDSNGDGIGDIAGIIQRLDHVEKLGVDAIWLSPFFTSPMLDFGYDVSDYRDVDPMFGTLEDFDDLIAAAHSRGIKIIIDLVLSHTSDQHPWFVESRADRENVKADWYVWADAKPDGTPPNNWLSIFGGSSWEWDGQRMQYYLHNFLIEQPDLNFHNAEVRQELLDVARFWLDRGVDGFRLDTVNFYYCDAQLRDNPALPDTARNDSIAPAVNPYNFQEHLYDKNQPENLEFLRELRDLLNSYDAITTVGEVGDAQRGSEIQATYTGGGDKLHMAYDFALLANAYPTGTRIAEVMKTSESFGQDSWGCWAYSNHDVERHGSRWRLSDEAKRVYAALLMCLRGSVCLYQGEELGLEEAEVPFEALQDPYGKRFWPKFKGRDGCRTPMVWQSDNRNGGFSTATPWLPVSADHLNKSVSSQQEDATSMLAFYQAMIAFRKTQTPLLKGHYAPVSADDAHIAFEREHDGHRILCVFNLSDAPISVPLPSGEWTWNGTAPFEDVRNGETVSLGPWQAAFANEKGAL
ncbi:alpha-glucosidase [Shimia isoporae]|uniref:Alpha-glucosidase n=1 Tax=Shimia isoporae TaxID=647720 RepID=A0A4R1NKQ4_9RHOB|nr:alpha-glucosidase family protein [Shimia isoporae]TCL08814.1 alpha-glucosidase [Shimia isoporae]